MSNSIAYISENLRSRLANIACRRFKVMKSDIALIVLQNQKTEYRKAGIDVASDVLDFVLFDHNLKKIGVIKRSDIVRNKQEESRP